MANVRVDLGKVRPQVQTAAVHDEEQNHVGEEHTRAGHLHQRRAAIAIQVETHRQDHRDHERRATTCGQDRLYDPRTREHDEQKLLKELQRRKCGGEKDQNDRSEHPDRDVPDVAAAVPSAGVGLAERVREATDVDQPNGPGRQCNHTQHRRTVHEHLNEGHGRCARAPTRSHDRCARHRSPENERERAGNVQRLDEQKLIRGEVLASVRPSSRLYGMMA